MNHTSEWKKIYNPKFGKYVYKHKGTGVVVDSLFKIGKVLKKPLLNLAKKAGKQVAEKGIAKASDVVVKKAGEKIGNVLRRKAKRPAGASRGTQRAAIPTEVKKGTIAKSNQSVTQNLIKLNNLIAQL